MAIVLERLADGREVHQLTEFVPIRFRAPTPRRSTPRRMREAARLDDFGVVTGGATMRTHTGGALAFLALEGVPIVEVDNAITTGMIGVEFPERPAARGGDMTHILREAGVPLIPRAEEGATLAGSKFAWGEDAEDEADGEAAELFHDEDEGAEGEEEDESHLSEDEARDDLADYVEAVAGDTHAVSRGLLTLAGLLRRQRRAGHAAAGMLG